MITSHWNEPLLAGLESVARGIVREDKAVDASDIVSTAIVGAYGKRDQFRGTTEAELRAWLRTIVVHECINQIRVLRASRRDARRTVSLDGNSEIKLTSRENSPIQNAGDREVSNLLGQLLEQLGDQAELVYLNSYCGLSHAELAARFGVSKNQVTNRLRTAHKRLRKAMATAGLDALSLL